MQKQAGIYTLTLILNPKSIQKMQYFQPVVTIQPRCEALSYFDQNNTFNQQVYLTSLDDVKQFFNLIHSLVLPISNYKPVQFSSFINLITIQDQNQSNNKNDKDILQVIKQNKGIQPFFEQLSIANETTMNAKITQTFINKKLKEFDQFLKQKHEQTISLVPMMSIQDVKDEINSYLNIFKQKLQTISIQEFYQSKFNFILLEEILKDM